VIITGVANFDAELIQFPRNAFKLDLTFAVGLGGAMRIAIYDYFGYYNVCHLGEEVRQPDRTIPRAVMMSVVLVAVIYLTMNISIIGVVPWRDAMHSGNIAADFMERLYGRPTAVLFTALILWTALACMFAITLGYSRIPYAAARQGDFFRVFALVHSERRYPLVSLLALGVLTAGFCFLDLQSVIDAAVCVRIVVQFIGQIVGLHLVHTTRPDISLPFRMWLYPLPSLIALAGWLFVFATSGWFVLLLSFAVIVSGTGAFMVWNSTVPRMDQSPTE